MEEKIPARRHTLGGKLTLDLYTFFCVGLLVLTALWLHKWITLIACVAVLVLGFVLFRWELARRGALAAILGAGVAVAVAIVF